MTITCVGKKNRDIYTATIKLSWFKSRKKQWSKYEKNILDRAKLAFRNKEKYAELQDKLVKSNPGAKANKIIDDMDKETKKAEDRIQYVIMWDIKEVDTYQNVKKNGLTSYL